MGGGDSSSRDLPKIKRSKLWLRNMLRERIRGWEKAPGKGSDREKTIRVGLLIWVCSFDRVW